MKWLHFLQSRPSSIVTFRRSHPYRRLERAISDNVHPSYTVLDIGCGRRAPNLMQLKGRAKTLIGIDLVDFELTDSELLLVKGSVCDMSAVPSDAVDLSYSRSVMEHIKDAQSAYSEISRVLKPGGKYIFLTPSAWDYASIIAYLVPNRVHAKLVNITEGREETDVFPVFYRSNTFRKISALSEANDLVVESFTYLSQYSCYFTFSRTLFYIGSRYEKFLERHRHLQFLRGWILYVLSKRLYPGRAQIAS